MNLITLDAQEFFLGAQLGVMRNCASILNGGTDKNGLAPKDRWWTAIEGACGEIAFARAYGLFWHGGLNQRADDLRYDVAGYDVKTMSSFSYLLRIRPDEAAKPIWYGMVRGVAPRFEVHGCYWGRDALEHPEWLSDLQPVGHPATTQPKKRPPAYLIPMSELRPVLGPVLKGAVAAATK
jgi:hypothetical protein